MGFVRSFFFIIYQLHWEKNIESWNLVPWVVRICYTILDSGPNKKDSQTPSQSQMCKVCFVLCADICDEHLKRYFSYTTRATQHFRIFFRAITWNNNSGLPTLFYHSQFIWFELKAVILNVWHACAFFLQCQCDGIFRRRR